MKAFQNYQLKSQSIWLQCTIHWFPLSTDWVFSMWASVHPHLREQSTQAPAPEIQTHLTCCRTSFSSTLGTKYKSTQRCSMARKDKVGISRAERGGGRTVFHPSLSPQSRHYHLCLSLTFQVHDPGAVHWAHPTTLGRFEQPLRNLHRVTQLHHLCWGHTR